MIEGHLDAFLARVVAWVERGEPWGTLAAAAKADAGPAIARTLGAWVAEDLALQGKPQGAASAQDMRARAASTQRAVSEAVAMLGAQVSSASSSVPAAQAREELVELLGGETDTVFEAVEGGFARASGAPLVGVRRDLALSDLEPDGPRSERVRFARPVAPPAGLALEPIAQLRQDLARLKHYALRDAVGKSGRPLSFAASSSYFKVIRGPVSLDGDLSEVRAMSGVANAADAWSDAARAALLAGFEERLAVRRASNLAGPASEVPAVLCALEIERAAADLRGALSREPESAVIPAEGLLALVISAPLPTGGLTP